MSATLMTIGQVSQQYAVSTRTLRYYETLGLLTAQRREGYAYRVYDEQSLLRLRQILLLRKLRIPLQKIGEVLLRDDVTYAVCALEESLASLNEEIGALDAVRTLLAMLLDTLRERAHVRVSQALVDDAFLVALCDSLPDRPRQLKEEKAMAELDKAQQRLHRLEDNDVRIVYIPPMTVASIHVQKGLGVSEDTCTEILDDFVRRHDLVTVKPDIRHFGFNHPDGTPVNGPDHGYEMIVSIPEDMAVEAPLTKRQFPGGMYAAHMIPMGAFEEWGWLFDWLDRTERYAYDEARNDVQRQNGMLEELLNYGPRLALGLDAESVQLDLLLPVRCKTEAERKAKQDAATGG